MSQSPLHFDLYIDGKAVPGTGGKPAAVRNPHDGSLVATVAAASVADLDSAVAAAQRAFTAWSSLTAYDREARIRKATTFVRGQAEAIGLLMAREQGKPLGQCKSEVVGSCDTIDYYAAEAVRIEGTINPTESSAYRSWVVHQPVGVCGLITPWNYPVSLLSWKLGPALATGCAVIVKPTSVTPLSPYAFCKALIDGGLPAGLLNVVTGSGALLGDALVKHPGVAKIAMTGSSDTGKRILSAAGPYLKKVSLELGGQCPAIVCADADLDNAAKVISYKGFRNCGQSCSSVNRVYVHASVAASFIEKLRAHAEKHSIGDPVANPAIDLGPMATRDGVETSDRHVRDAVAKGARLICGGKSPEGETYSKGHYYLPTVLAEATHQMAVMTEETFGPVVAVATFADTEEAIRLANDTNYGLVAYLFTKDLSTSVKVSERLEAGTVCVNHGAVNTNYGPYAGWKESGYGLELSRRAVFEYLKVKHIKVQI
jgi:succinate-semialdehyde dehydrogenase / glutarate-semialdehyde dehydrogenase